MVLHGKLVWESRTLPGTFKPFEVKISKGFLFWFSVIIKCKFRLPKGDTQMMLKKYSLFLLYIVIGTASHVKSQNITLTGEIYEYATYYVSSFNIQDGSSDVPIFRYQIHSDVYPVYIKVWFKASLVSPALGITSPQTIVEVETNPFMIQNDLFIDNRDVSAQTTVLYDMGSPPNPVTMTGELIDIINPADSEAIISSMLTSGKISDGNYSFELTVSAGYEPDALTIAAEESKTIVVSTPVSITLENPGGALADTLDNLLYTTFPIFQWHSQTCGGCQTFIRVGEFIPTVHSSLEDAIEEQRVLPFDQSQIWEPIGNATSFQYPFSGAYPLEEGKVYAWQVRVTLPTTTGSDEMQSSIFAFKLGTSGQIETTPELTNALLIALQQTLGDGQFNALFSNESPLSGYIPSGGVEINNVSVDEASVTYILNQIMNNDIEIINIQIEE